MKLAGCFNGTKTFYMPKDKGKFDFSCYDPFKVDPLMSHGLFNDVLTIFLGLERVSYISVYGGSESSRISSKIPSFVFGR